MINEYINILNSISPLGPESREEISEYISVCKVPRGGLILKYGEICRHIYFVNRGFVRIFYYKNGKDVTEWFADEKQFFFSITSYFRSEPSQLIIEAIEDCEIIRLSKEGQDRLKRTNLEISNLIIGFYTRSLMLSQNRMDSIQFETAANRYHNLLEQQPNILNKVPLQHVASFLGITQETLSRIRASI
jgi:CRP-like cAMP-binding protein